jgi:hydroxymethylglutaryl-CoA lyase
MIDRALARDEDLICPGVSASDTHSRRNAGMGIDEAVRRMIPMAKRAAGKGKRVQVSVQSGICRETPVPMAM